MAGYVVYQVTNTVNGKRYIGYTSKTLNWRWKEHVKRARLGSTLHFHRAINKHGAEAFTPEILFVEDTLPGAKETEILLILDRCPEYNKTFGGDGTTGHVVTTEARDRIRRNTPVKSGKDHPMFGRSRPDTVERNKGRTGVKNPKCGHKGENHPFYGASRPEVVAAMLAAKPQVVSAETKAKQSASAQQRSQTEEGLQHLKSAGRKGAEARWAKYRAEKKAQSFPK